MTIQYCNIELKDLGKFVFCIPLIYSYLLPDAVSPNVAGIIVSFLLSNYFSEADSDYVMSGVVGIVYVALAFSIVFRLLSKLTIERDKYRKNSISYSQHLRTLWKRDGRY